MGSHQGGGVGSGQQHMGQQGMGGQGMGQQGMGGQGMGGQGMGQQGMGQQGMGGQSGGGYSQGESKCTYIVSLTCAQNRKQHHAAWGLLLGMLHLHRQVCIFLMGV